MSILGRVDVYRTGQESRFIAVASSHESDVSGRPVRIEIAEFWATDPLYKATRIGAFADFEFRASELHDDVLTLSQVERLSHHATSGSRWWPVEPHGSIPLRAAELIYATLGPWVTSDLVHALETSSARGIDSVQQLLLGLTEANGRRPSMLIALTAAVGTAQRYDRRVRAERNTVDDQTAVGRFVDETIKHLGGLVVESAEQFGFTQDAFGEWFESQDRDLFDLTPWPPPQAPYTLHGPQFPNELAEVAREQASSSDSRASIDLRVDSASALFTTGRHDIFIQLAEAAEGHLEFVRSDGSLSPESARALARLVSATVQAWHHRLADVEDRVASAYDDGRFTWDLLTAIQSLPGHTWDGLSDARRICFVADLGELLMLITETTSGVVSELGAAAILHVCNGNDELLAIAVDAAYKIPFQNGRGEFDWAIRAIRERERQ